LTWRKWSTCPKTGHVTRLSMKAPIIIGHSSLFVLFAYMKIPQN